MLKLEDGTPFVSGRSDYQYLPVGEGDLFHRVIVQIQIDGIDMEAMLDTGGVYLICPPDMASLLSLQTSDADESIEIKIRGIKVRGRLYRRSVRFLADAGQNLDFEATLFVPDENSNLVWNLPAFLGMHGCLERIRFAVDPGQEQFYFGPIDWESS